jgi:prepilin-type N-terminal cleavage/methylation domain-containing protein
MIKMTNPQRGLSLVELLVVLTILAALTTIALRSTSGVLEQSRFEATQKTLENVRAAIVGESSNSSAVPVTGFVADMGRLPTSLSELLTQPADAVPFGLQAAPAPHSDVLVPSGWRGPYLRLPVGSEQQNLTQLADAWGSPLQSSNPTASSFLALSPAAPRSASNSAYNTDLAISIAANDWQAALLTGTLYRGTPTTDVWTVTLFSPGPASVNHGVALQAATIHTAPNGDVSYTLSSGLAIGPRVLRVTRNGTGFGNPVFLTLRAGATHIVNFHNE